MRHMESIVSSCWHMEEMTLQTHFYCMASIQQLGYSSDEHTTYSRATVVYILVIIQATEKLRKIEGNDNIYFKTQM